MMNGTAALPPLAAEEQRLSNAIAQITAATFEDVRALAALDVRAGHSVLQGAEAKVQEQLRRLRSLLSSLQYAAEEQETPEQVQRVATCVAYHQGEYDRLHKSFIDARVAYHRAKEQSYVQQRQELIGSLDFSQRQQKIASEQDALVGAQDVTASLRRTKQLMMQNLEQTHGNISVIAASNKRLQSAGDELTGQREVFKESHGLLGALKRQAMVDRLAFWGGFIFFMLVVAYISIKRTPGFMKQPLYSLLHMKHGGQPFSHTDYAAANIPPGTFIPTDKPWGSGDAAYPDEWAAWSAQFDGVQGPQDGKGVFADAEWLDAEAHEQVQRTGGETWQRGPDGTLLPPRLQRLKEQEQQHEQRQRQQQQQPDAPHTPKQEQESAHAAAQQCSEGDVACHAAAAAAQAAGFAAEEQPWGCSTTDGTCHTEAAGAEGHMDGQYDEEQPYLDGHMEFRDYHTWPTEQPDAAHTQKHDEQSAALGIIDPDAAATTAADAASSSTQGQAGAGPEAGPDSQAGVDESAAEEDADELEFLQQQQAKQQAEEAERFAKEQQMARLLEQEREHKQAEEFARQQQQAEEAERFAKEQEMEQARLLQRQQQMLQAEQAAAHAAAEPAAAEATPVPDVAAAAAAQPPNEGHGEAHPAAAVAGEQPAHILPPEPAAPQPAATGAAAPVHEAQPPAEATHVEHQPPSTPSPVEVEEALASAASGATLLNHAGDGVPAMQPATQPASQPAAQPGHVDGLGLHAPAQVPEETVAEAAVAAHGDDQQQQVPAPAPAAAAGVAEAAQSPGPGVDSVEFQQHGNFAEEQQQHLDAQQQVQQQLHSQQHEVVQQQPEPAGEQAPAAVPVAQQQNVQDSPEQQQQLHEQFNSQYYYDYAEQQLPQVHHEDAATVGVGEQHLLQQPGAAAEQPHTGAVDHHEHQRQQARQEQQQQPGATAEQPHPSAVEYHEHQQQQAMQEEQQPGAAVEEAPAVNVIEQQQAQEQQLLREQQQAAQEVEQPYATFDAHAELVQEEPPQAAQQTEEPRAAAAEPTAAEQQQVFDKQHRQAQQQPEAGAVAGTAAVGQEHLGGVQHQQPSEHEPAESEAGEYGLTEEEEQERLDRMYEEWRKQQEQEEQAAKTAAAATAGSGAAAAAPQEQGASEAQPMPAEGHAAAATAAAPTTASVTETAPAPAEEQAAPTQSAGEAVAAANSAAAELAAAASELESAAGAQHNAAAEVYETPSPVQEPAAPQHPGQLNQQEEQQQPPPAAPAVVQIDELEATGAEKVQQALKANRAGLVSRLLSRARVAAAQQPDRAAAASAAANIINAGVMPAAAAAAAKRSGSSILPGADASAVTMDIRPHEGMYQYFDAPYSDYYFGNTADAADSEDYANWVYSETAAAESGAVHGLLDDLDYYGDQVADGELLQHARHTAAGGAGVTLPKGGGAADSKTHAADAADASAARDDAGSSSVGSRSTEQEDGSAAELAELDDISRIIEEEQAKAFTIMDMEEGVGLYHYEPEAAYGTVEYDGAATDDEQLPGSTSMHTEL